jgi:hypothetical protein
MSDDLTRLLDLPAAARLSIAGDELALLTLRHEHADKIIIERQRLGTSIDLGELLQLIGGHGLTETPQLQVTEVAVPQLPAPPAEPQEIASAPMPTTRRTSRNQPMVHPTDFPCPKCDRIFKNTHALEVHQGRIHKAVPTVEDVPVPIAVIAGVDGLCDVCRQSVRLHERCSDCSAFLGPEHAAGSVVARFMDQPLCSTCTSFRDTARELGVAA